MTAGRQRVEKRWLVNQLDGRSQLRGWVNPGRGTRRYDRGVRGGQPLVFAD